MSPFASGPALPITQASVSTSDLSATVSPVHPVDVISATAPTELAKGSQPWDMTSRLDPEHLWGDSEVTGLWRVSRVPLLSLLIERCLQHRKPQMPGDKIFLIL